jgi:hypothetical protein
LTMLAQAVVMTQTRGVMKIRVVSSTAIAMSPVSVIAAYVNVWIIGVVWPNISPSPGSVPRRIKLL